MVDVVARLSGPVAVGSDSPASVSFGGGGLGGQRGGVAGVRRLPAGAGRARRRRRARARRRRRSCARPVSMLGWRWTASSQRGPASCWWARRRALDAARPGGERRARGRRPARRRCSRPAGTCTWPGYALVRPGPRPAARSAIARAVAAGMTRVGGPVVGGAAVAGVPGARRGGGAAAAERRGGGRADRASATPGGAARALAARFPEVVVKLGAEGALWTDGSEEVRVPAAAAASAGAALDTTGAGDAFAAGLLAARLARRGARRGARRRVRARGAGGRDAGRPPTRHRLADGPAPGGPPSGQRRLAPAAAHRARPRARRPGRSGRAGGPGPAPGSALRRSRPAGRRRRPIASSKRAAHAAAVVVARRPPAG